MPPRAIHRALFILLATLGAGLSPARSDPAWLDDAAIETTFAGATFDGYYSDGTTYRETYMQDRTLDYREPDRHMRGHWSVVNRSFCTIYDDQPSGGCFRVHRVSQNCYEFYFLTRTEQQAASPNPKRPSWTARGWSVAAPSTCEEKPAV